MNDFSLLLSNLQTIAIIFAIVGVAWQFMRLLSKLSENVEEFKQTNNKLNLLIDKATVDYEYISSTLKNVSKSVEAINSEIIVPIQSIGKIFKLLNNLIEGIYHRFLPKK